ncbi:hypothetical protein PGTUg99_006660 [Puccinia graminis f. sp. tritici]|uniref:Uncharacterized protein n=1 Tax=Puccinia graminis f. sp. tritici TaxID=56615 RepID=A0A5B0SDU5_PUCGR|nr:hypothetical protein PGTUg99_006660 [Puccinia graminis f. sp. tritici]
MLCIKKKLNSIKRKLNSIKRKLNPIKRKLNSIMWKLNSTKITSTLKKNQIREEETQIGQEGNHLGQEETLLTLEETSINQTNKTQANNEDPSQDQNHGRTETLTSAPITKKHRVVLASLHQLYSTSITYKGYRTALDSVIQLYNSRTRKLEPASSYSNTLSSRIHFNPLGTTSLKGWVKNLRREGPDVFSPSSNEPFFRPDVWNFPTNSGQDSAKQEIGSELFSLFTILCYPTDRIQHNIREADRPYQ